MSEPTIYCSGTWRITGDPDTSLWWDVVHPTTRAHELLPEPSAALLMAIAALTLLRWRR